MPSDADQSFVTIVVPALNEERHIVGCLTSLLAAACDVRCEILVVDGGSTDRTVELASGVRATSDVTVSVVHNPKRLQSAAVNMAAGLAAPHSRVLLRADAHAHYPADFIRTAVMALRANGATSVVVPMITEGITPMQRAVAAAQNSRLGNGGSSHRTGGRSGFIEHGHHAVFDLAFFRQIGGYNETFSHNEDAELDIRALRAGGRIWMCREAPVTYFPRGSIVGVARQYINHGRGRARTLLLHRQRPKLRQMAPLAILGACILGFLLALADPRFLGVPLAYLLACLGWGVAASIRARDPALLAMGPAAVAMHLGWAVGFVSEVIRHLFRRAAGGRNVPAADAASLRG